jgi:hypothetical protein
MSVTTSRVIETIFLTALLTGISSVILGVFLTLLNWRPDVPPYGRHIPKLNLLLYPDKYARSGVLLLIRMLNTGGIALLMLAIFALLWEAILEFSRKPSRRTNDSVFPRNVVIAHIQNCNLTLAARVATLEHERQFTPERRRY